MIISFRNNFSAYGSHLKKLSSSITIRLLIKDYLESKFLQAINNLLSNSLKFTPNDGSIEVSVTEPDEKNILITVKDNGIGIPTDLQPFLFEKFTKARRKGVNGEPTIGLGMSIIKTIIEWHNGRIWFDSTEGKGTTFYIEIPKDN